MGSRFPPDNWEMVTGVWGTDADRNEVTTKTGRYTVELLPTLVATEMESGFIPIDEEFSSLYQIEFLFAADSITAGDNVVVSIDQYDINENLVTTTAVHAGTAAVINVFEIASTTFLAGGTVRFAKIRFSKAATAFSVFLDHAFFTKIPRHLRAQLGSNQSIPDNTWTTIVHVTSGFIPVTAGVATIETDSMNWVGGQAMFDSLIDGQAIEIRIVEKPFTGGTLFHLGGRHIVGGAGDASVAVHKLIFLKKGDTVEIQVRQSGASAAKDAIGTAFPSPTFFDIGRIIGA